jgi:hypothetical protein
MTDLLDAIPQKHSDMLAAAWRAQDRRLAERFRQAMMRARAVPADDHDRRRRREAADTNN